MRFLRRMKRLTPVPSYGTSEALEPSETPVAIPDGIYGPLNAAKREIRLLRMTPSTDPADDTIRCELQTFSLNDRPTFTALSYAWGSQAPTDTIDLDGHIYTVRPNLYAYLNLRRCEDDAPEWIFVDALCIDQASRSERETQVVLMGDIYREADQVIAWLGVYASLSREEVLRAEECFEDPTVRSYDALTEDQKNICSDYVLDFAQPSYWLRVWIVQEIVLARKLVIRCGPLITSAETFLRGMKLIVDKYHPILNSDRGRLYTLVLSGNNTTQDVLAIAKAQSFLESRKTQLGKPKGSRQQSMAEVLLVQHSQHCTERHDAVIGCLGLSRSCLRPNYSIPIMDLFLFTLIEAYLEHIPQEFRGLAGTYTGGVPQDLETGFEKLALAVTALMISLHLSPKDKLVALILLQAGELFLGKRKWPLCSYLLKSLEFVGATQKRFYVTMISGKLRSRLLPRRMRSTLLICRIRDSVMTHPDAASENMTYSAWVNKIKDQIATCSRLLWDRELEELQWLMDETQQCMDGTLRSIEEGNRELNKAQQLLGPVLEAKRLTAHLVASRPSRSCDELLRATNNGTETNKLQVESSFPTIWRTKSV